jgi:hypothetical protein
MQYKEFVWFPARLKSAVPFLRVPKTGYICL